MNNNYLLNFKKNSISNGTVQVDKLDKSYFDNEISKLQSTYEPNLAEYWKTRTNQPYKNILKNENYNKTFKTKEDLIVHKITNADREGLIDEYKKLMDLLEKHNNELRLIYSTSKKTDHLKKFEYTNKYQFVKYNPTDFVEMKQSRSEQVKKEQETKEQVIEIIQEISQSVRDKYMRRQK